MKNRVRLCFRYNSCVFSSNFVSNYARAKTRIYKVYGF